MKIEEIELDEELELIEKTFGRKVDFPAVTLTQKSAQMYFNVYARDLVPDHINWSTTTNYVVGLPTNATDKDAFHARKSWKGNGVVCFCPVALLKEKKVKEGTYKVYKYKNGFAFKRYEPLFLK